MIFQKETINDTLIYKESVISLNASLYGLLSRNSYNITLTFSQTPYYSSELAINAKVYNDVSDEYVDITLQPATLTISKNVNGSSSTVNINVYDSVAYYYGSPYYNLIKSFYTKYYQFKEDTFISDFFSIVPEYEPECIFITNPKVDVKPNIFYQQNGYITKSVLSYYVSESNFDLYTEPVDNSNQFQLLNSLNQVPSSHLSSDDYHDIIAIETYNRNYLLAHLQSNVTGNLEISGDINASTQSSGGGSSVDLSGVVTQLQNISNKLTYIHGNNVTADLAELLFYCAEALEYGLTYDDQQQNKHSFLDDLNKKLEYTQTIDDETVTKNITETLSDVLKSLDDISDRPIITTNEDLTPWSRV